MLLFERLSWSAILVLAWLGAPVAGQEIQPFDVRSPDGKNTIAVSPGPGGSGLSLAVARNGRELVRPSRIGLRLAEQGSITDKLRLTGIERGELDESFDLPWGKCRTVHNRCRWARARFTSAAMAWVLELRAYDDGVAFRYVFPVQPPLADVVIEAEESEVCLAAAPTVHFMTCKNFRTDHENEYQQIPLADVPAQKLIDLPVLAVWPEGTAAAITEARLRHFTGLYFERRPQEHTWQCRLSPLPSRADACVVGHTPLSSSWRVVLLSDHAGKLIESNLLLCLNDPPPAGDYSWAQPGKTTWHWWNGTAEQGLGFKCDMNFETHRHYIDFCAQHKIAYHAVVADHRPWHVQSKADFAPQPDTDILTPRPELELPRILDYAKQKGVGIRLWVHWKPLDEHLEEAFAQYEKWGVRGLMVDFLDRDDQEMVEFCERVLESAARHRLHIQFHGSYKPSGEQRTFPHLFNREGVLNLEYLKWSKRCTPPHNVGVAYTRLLAGPLDYHLGGFQAISRNIFEPRNENPLVLGTRCHQLAMYVVYENPMPMVSDAPSVYSGQTGFDFITAVPTTWDETRFLAGEPGEYVVVARRHGRQWYLGGMTNWTPRDLAIPLDFIGDGKYQLTVYRDGSLAEDQPNAIQREEQPATAKTVVRVSLAPGGGLAAVLRPQ
ncbi:MAG: glycoside hydrolase family 97 protein [Pirellulales bacterium]